MTPTSKPYWLEGEGICVGILLSQLIQGPLIFSCHGISFMGVLKGLENISQMNCEYSAFICHPGCHSKPGTWGLSLVCSAVVPAAQFELDVDSSQSCIARFLLETCPSKRYIQQYSGSLLQSWSCPLLQGFFPGMQRFLLDTWSLAAASAVSGFCSPANCLLELGYETDQSTDHRKITRGLIQAELKWWWLQVGCKIHRSAQKNRESNAI